MLRARPVLCALAVALVLAAPSAVAAGTAPQPLQVVSSSVSQTGLQVTWTVQLASRFAPASLARDHRSLCLLLERVVRRGAWGQLCLGGSRSGRVRLRFSRVSRTGAGPAVTVDAVLHRQGATGVSAAFVPTSFGMPYRDVRWQVQSTLSAAGCSPPTSSSGSAGASSGASVPDCALVFPARGQLARLHTPRLVGCVPHGPPFVAHGPTAGREIALTFDDGPWYDTPQFLALLERYHVPATFFEIGRQVGPFGQGGAVERRMLADGDMIGDHTWSHPNVAAGGELARSQILATANAIRQATHGFYPCLFRAPYGATSPALIRLVRSLGFTAIQWDIDPRDWALPGAGAIYDNVVANAHPGAIVLQHDGGGNRSETLAALPLEIRTLLRRGYRFVTVTQLLGMNLIYR